MPFPLTLITTDAAESWPLSVPTRWADVTLGQFVHLFAGPSELVPAEILCGLPAGTVERLSLQAVVKLANLLAFAADPGQVLELPATVADPGELPYGTFLLVQQYLAATPDKPELFYLPRVLALYRVTQLYGKADAAKVAACEAALLAAPVTESYAEAAAFYGACKRWLRGTPPTKPTPSDLNQRKKTRAARSWQNALALCSAWMQRRAARSSTTLAP